MGHVKRRSGGRCPEERLGGMVHQADRLVGCPDRGWVFEVGDMGRIGAARPPSRSDHGGEHYSSMEEESREAQW